jgi:antitoxin (DNA-binding transcriptional repressor) of toxin-antitoxin stability system
MKQVSVRDLRYRFPEVERLLRAGATVELTKYRRVIARIQPAKKLKSKVPLKMPDYAKLLKRLYGNKVFKISNAELLSQERDRY